LQLTARALPRLDEDDRLSPILTHLSHSFTAPDATYDSSSLGSSLLIPNAQNIHNLSQHFPLCMSTLQSNLKQTAHLKHYGRLQYTLFLKGLGMSLEDCIEFWRRSFRLITDEKFQKEYKYNIRHAYGDVGGDSNRRGRGYTPYSCQKLLTEALPSGGQSHGCPYRTFSVENLMPLLQSSSVVGSSKDPSSEKDLMKGIRDDVGRQRYHLACNRVFEYAHARELKRVKEEKLWSATQLDTLLHPNEYFKRSFLLKHLDDQVDQGVSENRTD
jgi:DNA primase large subunit